MKTSILALFLTLCGVPATPQTGIHELLRQRVDTLHQATGIVVGIASPAGRRIVAYGTMGRGDPRPVDGDTLFEIGSLTKVFTATLLAEMVSRGEVALSDPVARYLPRSVHVPRRAGRAITLIDLATHTSGLPRLPGNIHPTDAANPYADYSASDLYQLLSSSELTRDIGSRYEYSSLGFGLLGTALARRAGVNYESLLDARILRPLAMDGTCMTVPRALRSRLATGHDALLAPMPAWAWGTLAGAGALRSSANDLLTFLALHLGMLNSPLTASAAALLDVRRETGIPGVQTALGWLVVTRHGAAIVAHDGGTFGFRSFAGFEPKRRVGVVVLANAFTFACCNDLGEALLALP